ncbi:MAG: ABC transporter permease subunit [Lachnospiraceae bacterium]
MKDNLTAWELKQIEAKPQTFKSKLFNRLVSFLPVLTALLVLLQYKFIPDKKVLISFKVYEPTNLYAYFIGFFLAAFIIMFTIALCSKKVYEKWRSASPLLTAVFLLLLAYDFATLKARLLHVTYFPAIDDILNALITEREQLWINFWHSMILLFTGYFSGVAAGLICGILSGYIKKVRYWVMPLIKVLGPIPSNTWLPIILVLPFISLFQGAVFIIALGVWYPVTMTTMNGVINIPAHNYEVAKTFGVGRLKMIYKIAIPASSPFIFQGLTQGMSIACTVLLIAEMMGVEAGVGWYINWQRGYADFAKVYAAIIILCLTFFAVNTILNTIKNRVLRWREDKV